MKDNRFWNNESVSFSQVHQRAVTSAKIKLVLQISFQFLDMNGKKEKKMQKTTSKNWKLFAERLLHLLR